MSKNIFIFSICMACLGCTSNQQTDGDITEINVSGNYRDKEILLSDIADISYVQFKADNNSDYLFRGDPLAVTENAIVIYNTATHDFLFFTKDGSPKSVFNKRGNGPEDYLNISHAVYDEQKDELFAVERNRIKVYSSEGEYKRTLTVPKNVWISEIASFDENSLLLFDNTEKMALALKRMQDEKVVVSDEPEGYASSFVRISKIDGDVEEYIRVPQNFNIELSAPFQFSSGDMIHQIFGRTDHILNYKEGFLLYNHETDTVFFYDKTETLIPTFVRTPSISATSPMVYVNGIVETDNYQFLSLITLKIARPGLLQSDHLVRDKQDGTIYKQRIVFDDYDDKEIFISPINIMRTRDSKVGLITLPLFELKEANSANKLKGQLKSLVESMDEEENDICVLLYFR